MKFRELKEKFKTVKKSTWIFILIMAIILAAGIACGLVAMYMCGYTLATWLASYGGWLILIFVIIIMAIIMFVYIRAKRGLK